MIRHALSFLVLGALTACNAIAGIGDYREGTPGDAIDSGSGGGAAKADAGSGGDDGATPNAGDAGSDGAADLPAGCIPIVVDVVASTSGAYLGVEIRSPANLIQKIPSGESRTLCGALNDLLELRGDPDDTHAAHRWDGTPCGIDSRCRFTITGPTHVTARLQ